MNKRALLAAAAVFFVWSLMDYVIHGLLLRPVYAATAQLWRPMDEMKMPLMSLVTLLVAGCFTALFAAQADRSIGGGLRFGALFGAASGISMGFGSYCYMPISQLLAWSWCAAMLSESLAAGLLVGLIMRERP